MVEKEGKSISRSSFLFQGLYLTRKQIGLSGARGISA